MHESGPDSIEGRAAARRTWPARSYSLGREPGDNLSAITTAEQRLAMMWPLALEAWLLTGRPLPEYERAHSPVVVRNLVDADLDELGGKA
jgi:hypothetical protein